MRPCTVCKYRHPQHDRYDNYPSIERPVGPYPTIVKGNATGGTSGEENGQDVLVVQAYAYSKYLGYLELEINDTSGDITSFQGAPILLDSTFPECTLHTIFFNKRVETILIRSYSKLFYVLLHTRR